MTKPPPIPNSDHETFDMLQAARPRILAELGKAIVGQRLPACAGTAFFLELPLECSCCLRH